MKKFQEYLDNKGKVQGIGKNDVRTVADEVEEVPAGRQKMPPKEEYGPSGGNHQPYTPDGKKVISAKGKPFGNLGDNKPYDVRKRRDSVKLPTAEFTYHELLPKIRDAIKSHPAITENLVRELQRNKLLGILVGEMLSHNETYAHIAEVMASKNHGPSICRKLAKAMREGVAAPFHQSMDQDDEMNSGGVDPNLGLGTDDPDGGRPSMNFGGGDDDMGDDDMGDEGDEFGNFGDDDEMGDDGMGGGDDLEAKVASLEAKIKELEAKLGGGEMGPDQGGDTPPEGQPMPPNPNQPPVPPQPAGPPAMENMRRAMRSIFESNRPLRRKAR